MRFRHLVLLGLIVSNFPISTPVFAQSLVDQEEAREKAKAGETNPYLAYKEKRRGTVKELETCSWLVTYRKRIYDLSPLMRKGLSRPLEGDMHTILRRVPGAEDHLEKISKNNRAAKVHTAIASFALIGLVGSRIAQGNSTSRSKKRDFLAIDIGAALLFVGSVYAGYQLRQDTKEELVKAVQEFNNVSEDPILPYEGGL